MPHIDRAGLKVDELLVNFLEKEALPGTQVSSNAFWAGLARLVADFGPRNRELLAFRERLQSAIDDWHRKNGPVAADPAGYESFLREIGYLVPEPADFTIETNGLDPEISTICGPQLVVPVSNARYALNAANARWGSLYDALYGTDVIPREGELAPGRGYNERRGAAVVARAAAFLDEAFPLARGSHADVTAYVVAETAGVGALAIDTVHGPTALKDQTQFVGFAEKGGRAGILLRHNGLHVELAIDRSGPVGSAHPAGLADVIVESALTTIQDCEDSVAAVDRRQGRGLSQLARPHERTSKIPLRRAARFVTRSSMRTGFPTRRQLKGAALLLCRNVSI